LRQANENTEEARRTTRALRLLLAAQMKSVSKAIESIDTETEMDSLSYNWDYTANLTPEQAEVVSKLMGQVLNEVKKMDNPIPMSGKPTNLFTYRGICLLVRTKEASLD